MSSQTEDEELPEPEVPFDAGDPKQVNDSRKKAARLRQKRVAFVRQMMNDENGRLWMYDMLESCYIFGNALQPGQTDVTFFNLGQQNVGKKMLADVVEICPDLYIRMMQEGKAEK